MSNCCSTAKKGACVVPARQPSICPACDQKAKSVPTLTVKSLVREHWRVPAGATFSFCHTPECDVVYFSDEVIFRKSEIKVRVGIKEQADPVPLCYCFEYTKTDIRNEIQQRFKTDIPDRIKAEVQGGFCACETKNPAGTCCLGDINRAIQEAKQLVAANSSVSE